MSTLQQVIMFFTVCFIISIPVSFLIGAVITIVKHSDKHDSYSVSVSIVSIPISVKTEIAIIASISYSGTGSPQS